MESVVEGLLYVQGDLGITLKDIERILEIDEEEAKRIVLSLKNYYDDNYLKNRLRIVYHNRL